MSVDADVVALPDLDIGQTHNSGVAFRSWRKYVRLFYLEAMDVNRDELTLTLRFITDPDLTLKFRDKTKCARPTLFSL